MLVTLQQGWRGYEVRKFLEEQAVVTEIEWDQVRYSPRADDADAPGNSEKSKSPGRKRPRSAASKRGGKSRKPRKARKAKARNDADAPASRAIDSLGIQPDDRDEL